MCPFFANQPLCVNHDDGETGSQIVCSECGPLCVDCDRVLHLPRRCRSHQRQVCKEEEEAIKVSVWSTRFKPFPTVVIRYHEPKGQSTKWSTWAADGRRILPIFFCAIF